MNKRDVEFFPGRVQTAKYQEQHCRMSKGCKSSTAKKGKGMRETGAASQRNTNNPSVQ